MTRWFAAAFLAAIAIAAFAFFAPRSLAAQAPAPEPFYPNRFTLHATPGSTILLDTTCGATYRLREAEGKAAIWERLVIDDKGVSTPYPPSATFNCYSNLRAVLETFYSEPEKKAGGGARP